MLSTSLNDTLRWAIFPGVNLHARLRYRELPRHFGTAPAGTVRRVLDAGCGNGMLSYKSYLKGNSVCGISIKSNEVETCRRLFNGHLGIPEDRMRFDLANLYTVSYPDAHFDEIICTEVLEHIERDDEMCSMFWRILKPGGALHICAPNAAHPYNAHHHIDEDEGGGHVRAGYTFESYDQLLSPIGFKISQRIGVGGPVRQAFNRKIKESQQRAGPLVGVPLFCLAIPFLPLDGLTRQAAPFSLYVKATKPVSGT